MEWNMLVSNRFYSEKLNPDKDIQKKNLKDSDFSSYALTKDIGYEDLQQS